MVKKLDLPNAESELRNLLDKLYQTTKDRIGEGKQPNFNGLLEIMMCETNILTAIHNIKSNNGSNTKGVDEETMGENILQEDYSKVIRRVKNCFAEYSPNKVKRVFIPKRNKDEFRPLGIPTIIDRIIQECVRIVIEPIMEAQFFEHSYGFRPMRDAKQALERVADVVHKSGNHWIVEGDIEKFFDTINHNKLIHNLWNMGIKDKRVLMIIKSMLKSGILDEKEVNDLGTPQGGIISPLLANVYLHNLDKWITREWEDKKLRTTAKYATNKASGERYRAMKTTKLKPAFLIRYADDWVLITNSEDNAIKWKNRICRYLREELKLELSEKKTLITNIRKKPIHFLGYELKVVKGNSRKGYVTRTYPDRKRLQDKVQEVKKKIYNIRKNPKKVYAVNELNLVNSQIRGIIQYYENTTWGVVELRKHANTISYAGYKALKEYGAKWCPANQSNNLISVHSEYRSPIPTIEINGMKVGLTKLTFFRWEKTKLKNQKETPYTTEGRTLYENRTGKRPLLARADDMLSSDHSSYVANNMGTNRKFNKKYNFEFFLNRAYAFNRDKGKCRVCGKPILYAVYTHHIDPNLPMDKVNKVGNLASTHPICHKEIHSNEDYSHLGKEIWIKIKKFREKLVG
jgi:group II intron reverse transcriptase/maturase